MQELFGVIYSAKGQAYVDEAAQSVRSAKKYMPNIGYALVTDEVDYAESLNIFTHVYQYSETAQDVLMRNLKIIGMLYSPFKKTLFLDTDTYFLGPIYELIPLLDKFDLAFTHDSCRFGGATQEVPMCFPEPNGGMLLFNNNETCRQFIHDWLDLYLYKRSLNRPYPLNVVGDQGPFRHTLWDADHLRYYVLPPEYNLRAYMAYAVAAPVKILHCRGRSLKRAIRRANRRAHGRCDHGKNLLEHWIYETKQLLKRPIPREKLKDPRSTWKDYQIRSMDVSHYRERE